MEILLCAQHIGRGIIMTMIQLYNRVANKALHKS
jgi:hypothetical protein